MPRNFLKLIYLEHQICISSIFPCSQASFINTYLKSLIKTDNFAHVVPRLVRTYHGIKDKASLFTSFLNLSNLRERRTFSLILQPFLKHRLSQERKKNRNSRQILTKFQSNQLVDPMPKDLRNWYHADIQTDLAIDSTAMHDHQSRL